MRIHTTLTPERWYAFSLFEQLGNIGSDIERTISWKNRGEATYSQEAFERALELLYFTIEDPKNRGPRRCELVRLREVLLDYFHGDNEYKSTDKAWQQYFYNFAYAAALQRGR